MKNNRGLLEKNFYKKSYYYRKWNIKNILNIVT